MRTRKDIPVLPAGCLDFLSAFMGLNGITQDDLAVLWEINKSNVYRRLRSPYITVNDIRAVFDGWDGGRYEICFYYRSADVEPVQAGGQRPAYDAHGGGSLDFLWGFLRAKNVRSLHISQQLGIAVSAVNNWRKIDDVPYYRLLQVADVLGADLEVEIRPRTVSAGARRQVAHLVMETPVKVEFAKLQEDKK